MIPISSHWYLGWLDVKLLLYQILPPLNKQVFYIQFKPNHFHSNSFFAEPLTGMVWEIHRILLHDPKLSVQFSLLFLFAFLLLCCSQFKRLREMSGTLLKFNMNLEAQVLFGRIIQEFLLWKNENWVSLYFCAMSFHLQRVSHKSFCV